MNLNEEMSKLCAQYGRAAIDYSPSGTGVWRIWFQDYHQHHGHGMHGGFAYQGASLEEAVTRLKDGVAAAPAQRGFHCVRGCPFYSELDY